MCTKKELEFSIFVIYHLAEKWDRTPPEVYQILSDTHILDDYIIACYDKADWQNKFPGESME